MTDVCEVHIKDSVLGKDFIENMTREDMSRLKKNMGKADIGQMRDLMNANIKAMVDDGIDFKIREISDIIKENELIDRYTRDRITGETIKDYSGVVKNRQETLMGRNSVDTRARNLRNHIRNKFYEFEATFKTNENTKAPKSVADIKKGSAEERELYTLVRSYEHEIDPSTLTPEKVQSYLSTATEMQRLALAVVTNNAYQRKLLAGYGISTKFSKNYVVRRRYDWAAVKELGQDGFAKFMYEKIDVEKTFGKGTSQEQALFKLADIYRDMEVNANKALDITSTKEFSGSKANSLATKIEWKGHNEAYDAFNTLSVGGLKDQLEQGANGLANRAIAVSEFGYNPSKVLENVSHKLQEMYGKEPTAMDQWRLSQIKRAEKELSGQQHLIQGSMTNFANNMRFISAFTKLGNAVTGTVLDAVDNGRQSFYMNGDFFGGVKDYISHFAKTTAGMKREEVVEVANHLNLIFSHMSNSEGMRLASGDIATKGGFITNTIQEHGSKAMNIATLLPTQTAFSNMASGLTGSRQFSKLVASHADGKLNKFQKDFLNEYGFSKGEMDALSSGVFESTSNWSDIPIYTGTNIRQALVNQNPAKMAKILGVEEAVAGEAVLKLATKIESVVNDFASRGTPKPELATKTLMMKNIEEEPMRVAIGLATQFLDTPIAQGQYVMELAQKLYRVNDGNLGGVIKDSAVPSAAYLTTGLSLYMAADAVMSVATNRPSLMQRYSQGDSDQRNSIMLNAIGRTGYAPFLFEMIETQTNGGYNKTALDTFGSPAMSMVRDGLLVANGSLGVGDFVRRNSPSNSIPLRAVNNWTAQFTGDKIWDDKQKTFFGGN